MKRSLKELRARKNLTQVDMAERLDISVQTYNFWENNFQKLSIEKATKVATVLDVTLDDIFFKVELENNSSKSKTRR